MFNVCSENRHDFFLIGISPQLVIILILINTNSKIAFILLYVLCVLKDCQSTFLATTFAKSVLRVSIN